MLRYDLSGGTAFERVVDNGIIFFIPQNDMLTMLLTSDAHSVLKQAVLSAGRLLSGKCMFLIDVFKQYDCVFDQSMCDVLRLIENLCAKKPKTTSHEHVSHIAECIHDIVCGGLPPVGLLRDKETKQPTFCSKPQMCEVKTVDGLVLRFVWQIPFAMLSFFEGVIIAPFVKIFSGNMAAILPVMFYEAKIELYDEAELLPILTGLGCFRNLNTPPPLIHNTALCIEKELGMYIQRLSLYKRIVSEETEFPVL